MALSHSTHREGCICIGKSGQISLSAHLTADYSFFIWLLCSSRAQVGLAEAEACACSWNNKLKQPPAGGLCQWLQKSQKLFLPSVLSEQQQFPQDLRGFTTSALFLILTKYSHIYLCLLFVWLGFWISTVWQLTMNRSSASAHSFTTLHTAISQNSESQLSGMKGFGICF